MDYITIGSARTEKGGRALGLIEAEAVDKLLYEELPMKYFCGRNLDTAVKNQAAIRERVAQIPAVDAVPVVRCKDCRWWRNEQCIAMNSFLPLSTDPNWFCADGERRESE